MKMYRRVFDKKVNLIARLLLIGVVLINAAFYFNAAKAGDGDSYRDPIWNILVNDQNNPAWLQKLNEPHALYTEYQLSTLAGHLINTGVATAPNCPNGGLADDGKANDCGVQSAMPAMYVWQNQFNPSIINASQQTGVPPVIIKNIFAWESEFWPRTVFINTSEFGLGRMTSMGADSLLRWNYPFYDSFCNANLTAENCQKVYVEQPEYIQSMLRGLVLQQVNADCSNCVFGLDLKHAEQSIPIFANTLVSNAKLVKHYIQIYTGRDASQVSRYEDLWQFTLASYNAGPGCFKNALSKTVYTKKPITWKNISSNLEPACRGAIAYVKFIGQTGSYHPENDPGLIPTATGTPIPTSTSTPLASETPASTATVSTEATSTPTDSTPTPITSIDPGVLEPLHVGDEVVVKVDPQQHDALLQTLKSLNIDPAQGTSQTGSPDTLIVQVDPAKLESSLLALHNTQGVQFAEPNYLVTLSGVSSQTTQPNDPQFPSQSNLTAIQIPQTWGATTTSQPVIVAVLDTGVDITHPDLINSIWQNSTEMAGAAGVDDDKNGYVDDLHGWNFVDSNNNVTDENGHGTHLAGIIGAGVNNGIGIAGIAPNARILPVKVLDKNGYGSYSNVADGIIYATNMGARVINLGFGGTGSSDVMQNAINYALAHNVLVVAASGNSGNATAYYPAGFPGVVAVSAVDSNNALAAFSSTGNHISLAAPGVGILSTTLGGNYASMSGTSMSSANVSGVAALLAGQPQFANTDLLRSNLLSSALDLGVPGFDSNYGYGLVQAFSALNYSGPIIPTPTPLPTATAIPPGDIFPTPTGVGALNTPPTINISAPTAGSAFAKGANVTFTGTAADYLANDLSSAIVWSSDIIGPIGTGASVSTTSLLPGAHVITAQITDSSGATSSAFISITITGTSGPHGGFSGATDQCALCHRAHSAKGDSYLTTDPNSVATSDTFCLSCHTTVSTHSNKDVRPALPGITTPAEAPFEVRCVQCHDPHGTENLFGIRPQAWVSLSPLTNSGPVSFTALKGANSFDDGSSPASNRLCVTCHANTSNPGTPMTYHNGGLTHQGGYDYAGQSCVTCHPHNADNNPSTQDGFMPVRGACDGCHGAPPATGAHIAHTAMAGAGTYGKTGSFNTPTQYIFGCGECHPTNPSKHMDGTVEVDLNPAGAPATSLKAKNDPSAAYNAGTCGGSYCHSGQQVTSSAVGNPTGLDSHMNLTYDPYTVTITRVFASTPNWTGGHVSGNCTDCHQFPLTTSFPTVQAGVGDSHQWVDDYGYGNLHGFNMGFAPVQCSTCHFGEITQASTTSRNAMDVTTYSAVPIADRTAHVNGQSNVVFTTTPIVYNTVTVNLSTALYDPAKKACGNVGCHLRQNYVAWGTPYRWWIGQECDLCHRYSLPIPSPLTTMSLTSSLKPHVPAIPPGSQCTTCHTNPHK